MIPQTTPDMSKVAGGWLVPADANSPILLGCEKAPNTTKLMEGVFLAESVISEESCGRVDEFMKLAPSFQPVSVQGLQEVTPETIGSFRATMWSQSLARELERLFRHVAFPRQKKCDDYTATDWHQYGKHRNWKYSGVSPLLRYMVYKSGGYHKTHFDAGYIEPTNTNLRTLMSFVIYFSTNQSGATQIIDSHEQHLKIWERNHEDWSRDPRPKEILASSLPKTGSVLFFDHRIAHCVQPYLGDNESRRIIRGDLFFEAMESLT